MTGQRQNNQYSLALWAEGPGAARTAEEQGIEPVVAAARDERPAEEGDLMEAICSQSNMLEAWKQVRANKGSAGVDGRSNEATAAHLRTHWPAIRSQLLCGTYRPQPVLRVDIPKPGGGVRRLGVPCVVDRLIQQAVLQVLQPHWDPTFSEYSYGFRPGRSTHQAVAEAQRHVVEGYSIVADMDLEKFFDRVNLDRLMARVAHRESDRRLLRLIRAFLGTGVLENGLVQPTSEGTPQGGPLSPLLSNLLLDELDKELERRGLRFCRYADDCNIYVRTQRAGERVKASVTRYLSRRLRRSTSPRARLRGQVGASSLASASPLASPLSRAAAAGSFPLPGGDCGRYPRRTLAHVTLPESAGGHADLLLRRGWTTTSSSPPTPLNLIEPPWYRPVCPVVWEGRSREAPPYPDYGGRSHVRVRSRRVTRFRLRSAPGP